MQIRTLNEILKRVTDRKQSKMLAVVAADDQYVLHAVRKAETFGLITPILIGNRKKIEQTADINKISIKNTTIIDTGSKTNPAAIAINEIKRGNADMLMKGFISTKELLLEIVKKDSGILSESILSHLAVFETPYYHKLLGVTDAAMNISPSVDDKISIIKNSVNAFQKLGIEIPKVALIAAIEKVNPKMSATTDAVKILEKHNHHQLAACILQGPIALDLAVSKEAAKHKHINGDVAGDADILLVPEIVSGNVLYKSLTCLGGAKTAGVILGAKVPLVLTSRADSEESKFFSIVLALSLC
ncbi:MAG: bifunctional enoyl-CoA hydratase/phosphate acetyltransferase [Bacteroidales bacterium]|nr:bifunctional enoyl-CoA hydratase/phosphate acetyltransferase [Bacteroidales bacterium]